MHWSVLGTSRAGRVPALAALAALVVAPIVTTSKSAHAVGTRTFVLDTLEKLSGGDLKGVSVSSDGAVRAGFTLGNTPVPDASASFSALGLSDGSVLVGTSPSGKVYKVAGDAMSLFADTGALAVTSMVQAKNGTIYAATIPDGKIFRISQGKADVFATLPETSHVWALVLDKAGTGLFAATGPEGKVFRVEPNGSNSVYFRSTESHIVSLAMAENGDLLAGSSGKGELYRISGPGRATVLANMPGEEVKAIAVGKGGVFWAIGNEYAEPPEPPKRSSAAGRTPAGPTSGTKPKPGKGTLVRFDSTGRAEKMMKHDDTHYLSLVLDEQGRPYVGTGEGGRVYTVDDSHVVTLVADADERQIGALQIAGGKGFIATSDPPVVHRILGRGGADAVWTSKPLDAGLRARFGTLTWQSSGPLEFSTRTGNTGTPDATWTNWTNPVSGPTAIGGTGSRYVQVRARWARDPNAVLTEVSIPFVTENVRPVVTEVSASSKGGTTKEPSGNIPASGGEVGKHDSVVKVTWKVENPDNDPLRYRVAFRKEGQTQWRDALKSDDVHTKTELEWDTAALPEGKYRVRIEASDEQANPPEQVQKHALESESVLVDNTPPRIENLQMAGRRLRGRVIDGTSPVARVEVAIDGKLEWRPVAAADGIYDTAEESIDADLSAMVPPGSHIVVVRAFDAAGNAVTRDLETH